MLHARIEVAQLLDMFQISCVITEFHAGEDQTQFIERPMVLELPVEALSEDPLSIVIRAIALWSERTIRD